MAVIDDDDEDGVLPEGLIALDRYLGSAEVSLMDRGLAPPVALAQLVSADTEEEREEILLYILKQISSSTPLSTNEKDCSEEDGQQQEKASQEYAAAQRSYRALALLKQQIVIQSQQQQQQHEDPWIPNPSWLAKSIFAAWSQSETSLSSSNYFASLLETLLESTAYADATVAAAATTPNLSDLLSASWPVATHVLCLAVTGGRPNAHVPLAEQSAQHTATYWHAPANTAMHRIVSEKHAKKFVKQVLVDPQWLTVVVQQYMLSSPQQSEGQQEEVCDAILTVLESIGFPPAKASHVSVGEEGILNPLKTTTWWTMILQGIASSSHNNTTAPAALARLAHQTFALATGKSMRIVQSHAPALDATEQADQKVVNEENGQEGANMHTNHFQQWGWTDSMHDALIQVLPTLIQVLDLPGLLQQQQQRDTALESSSSPDDEHVQTIRHPGKNSAVPFTYWRLQLLLLLKNIVCYKVSISSHASKNDDDDEVSPSGKVFATIMKETILPPDLLSNKKKKDDNDDQIKDNNNNDDKGILNPWPFVMELLFVYPHNDLAAQAVLDMFVALCLQHDEATLRLVLQKTKFVTRAIRAVHTTTTANRTTTVGCHTGVIWNCLNVLRLRRASLPPAAYLRQFLDSHDVWKGFVDILEEQTLSREQRPLHVVPALQDSPVMQPSMDCQSPFARQLLFGTTTSKRSNSNSNKPLRVGLVAKESMDSLTEWVDDGGGGAKPEETVAQEHNQATTTVQGQHQQPSNKNNKKKKKKKKK